ncbi:MAG: phosphatase PAP2 family protein [Nocardioides sp.]
MHRRAQTLLCGVAVVMSALAVTVAAIVDRPLVDPDWFLGPSWFRLLAMLIGAFVIDVVPWALWHSRQQRLPMVPIARARLRAHWTRERVTLLVVGLLSFYVTYFTYRNLKSFLPLVLGLDKYDRALHRVDQWLFLGTEPAIALRAILGDTLMAHFLSAVYLWFLPLVPVVLMSCLIWSRQISRGYWFAISQILVWVFGIVSYYLLPTQGPAFRYPWLYEDLTKTPTTDLIESLAGSRKSVVYGSIEDAIQSVAGFASLHCAITLLFALMAHYTVRNVWLRRVAWINFGLTIVATLYFGWHYVADDLAGVVIAVAAFRIGAWASGEPFSWRTAPAKQVTST